MCHVPDPIVSFFSVGWRFKLVVIGTIFVDSISNYLTLISFVDYRKIFQPVAHVVTNFDVKNVVDILPNV